MTRQTDKIGVHKTLSRREVLRGAAAAATAPYVLTGGALGSVGGLLPASDRIAVACVGVRNRGGRHLKSLLGDGGAEVVAVCDVDRSVRRRAVNRATGSRNRRWSSPTARKPAQLDDFRDVAGRDDIDAVVIATPDHSHAAISLAMIRAGRNVFVEKPVAASICDGHAVVDAAAAAGAPVVLAGSAPIPPSYRKAQRLVDVGAIGRLVRVEITLPRRSASAVPWSPAPVPPGFDYERWLGPAPWSPYTTGRCHYNWRFVSDYSGGELAGRPWRALELARRLIGGPGPVSVRGTGERFATGLYDTFHRVRVEWMFPGGRTVSCVSGEPAGVRLIGDRGWIDAETLRCSSPDILRATTDGEPDRKGTARCPAMKGFLAAVRAGTSRGSELSVEAGCRTATMCHLGEIAMRLGRPIEWDANGRRFVGGDAEAEQSPAWKRPCRDGWTL